EAASLSPAYADEAIALIGIGCRFPGGAHSPETFWQLIRDGKDAVTAIPPDRFDIARFYDSRPATPGKVISKWGGFLPDLDKFDATFFGISPREAERLDPQQRLLLEVAWEALENAGQTPEHLAESASGVFIGMWINDFEDRLFADPDKIDFYMTTGSGRYTASGRLSYLLGLRGPSVTLDTACSSSLVAVHLACQSLRSGECQVALAGGANAILRPHISIAYSQSQMLAPDGRCKFGDARANGYVRSEGAGLVVLKRLSQALADHDPIIALIVGSVVNNDGRSSGSLGTPGVAGQEDMLRQAYRRAGIAPGRVHYLEAHGTGTRAGDPVELEAIGRVLGADRPAGHPVFVGSVKTNIGHTEGAAGVAGLIKVALSLKHRLIPPSLHFEKPNPNIPWDRLNVAIPTTVQDLSGVEGPLYGGVSAFGISGTNAHVVLQEWQGAVPGEQQKTVVFSSAGAGNGAAAAGSNYLLPLSAKTPEALADLVRACKRYLETTADALPEICSTACLRRAHLEQRLAVVADSKDAMSDKLQSFLQGEKRPGLVSGGKESEEQRRIVFVFPGQGSQWPGMARRLLEKEPAFRDSMQRCEAALRQYVEWSLLEQLQLAESDSGYRLNQIDVIQPVLFSIQVSLAALWRAWGITPAAVVGHSMGEVAATHVAGALTLEEASRIICRRSQLLRRTSGKGAMAVVELTIAEAEKAIAGYEDRLAIAVSNSSRSTVLSGDPAALDEVIAQLERREIFCRRIKVDVASHSPQMDPLREELLQAIHGLQPRPADLPICSTVTGDFIAGERLDRQYWVNNLRQPVLFSAAVRRLRASGHDTFIEISAHPLLLPAIQQELQSLDTSALTLPSMRRDEDEQLVMLESLGGLYVAGHPVAWRHLHPHGRRVVRFPNYPWQRERHWFDEQPAVNGHHTARPAGEHPLLGRRFESAQDGTSFWENEISTQHLPYLAEHRVHGTAVLPAAAFVEMALAAARAVFGDSPAVLEKITFHEALFVPEAPPLRVQTILSPLMPGLASVQVLSRAAHEKAAWKLHASATLSLHAEAWPAAPEPPATRRRRLAESLSAAAHFATQARRGLQYGVSFQGLGELWRTTGEALGRLQLPADLAAERAAYRIHPALLDACFQTLLAAAGDEAQTYLPVQLASLCWQRAPQSTQALWAHAFLTSEGTAGEISGDVLLLDEAGTVLLAARGLRLQALQRETQIVPRDWFHRLVWRELPPPVTPAGNGRPAGLHWLLFADQSGVAQGLAERLREHGAAVTLVTAGTAFRRRKTDHFEIDLQTQEDYRRLLGEAAEWHGIVHLWSLDAAAAPGPMAALNAAPEKGCLSVMYLVQALGEAGLKQPPRLWLVTAGAQAVAEADPPPALAQSPLWGMGAVIANEHPEFKCTRLDLEAAPAADSATALTPLLQELLAGAVEDQVAFRNGRRYAVRLVKWDLATGPDSASDPVSEIEKVPAQPNQGFRVEISRPGILDHLLLRAAPRRAPGPGEIEIQVRAAGLNFLDVMKALGVYPGLEANAPVALGGECAGIVCAVGEGVENFAIGDEVMAITPSFNHTSLLASFVTVPARLAVPKPRPLRFAEAAAVPAVFLTAYYALHHLGRMNAGERVLIHSAAGGVGLAAVQLAQAAGCEIFATAGTPEKRAFLKSRGVHHVFDSRTLDFAGEIKQITAAQEGGSGVDLVLNSLTGAAIPKSLELLRAYGRFLEIGKRDIYQNSRIGLEPFKKNLAYFAIDLAAVISDRPGLIATLLAELGRKFESGDLQPLPVQVFPISAVATAFRTLAQGRHIGKLVLSFEEQNVPVAPAAAPPRRFEEQATYLITGGLGGLGLTLAQWLVEQGARTLVLVGRSAPTAAAQTALAALQAAGARVQVAQADVSQAEEVERVLAQIRHSLPPLKGVFHAAGLLADSTLAQMTAERFVQALRPKVQGAWHLHLLTREDKLDHFVLFSSVAALLGTTGQANYAAANAFLDSLAHYRRRLGLPALSINWGPWSQVGLAAAQTNRGERLESRGLGSLTPAQGLAALAALLSANPAQAAVMPFDFTLWRQFHPAAEHASLLAEFAPAPSAAPASTSASVKPVALKEQLCALESGRKRRTLLEAHLQEQIAQVLKLKPAVVTLNKPLRTLGMDSLMALELRNRLERSLGLTLPATTFFNYPTLAALTKHLAEKMEISLETDLLSQENGSKPPTPDAGRLSFEDTQDIGRILDELEQLSEEEARKILTK
ncbi:MAG: type I polyketide synthase, partial [candidate division KSB1 bacterium]|nr:type I polyketide synthase [candidate division KSB1 bacterium]